MTSVTESANDEGVGDGNDGCGGDARLDNCVAQAYIRRTGEYRGIEESEPL
jgi:hypothetical protein